MFVIEIILEQIRDELIMIRKLLEIKKENDLSFDSNKIRTISEDQTALCNWLNKCDSKIKYITEKDVSKITGRGLATLRNDRFKGISIPYVKFGKSVRYLLQDVRDFMEIHKIKTIIYDKNSNE